MASKPVAAAKQLSELLQEQQEPFILEAYINTESEVSFSCWSCNSSKFLKRPASCGLNKGRKVLPSCSKTLRALFNKLISIHNQKIKNSVSGDGDFSVTEIQRSYQDIEESDRFSSASCTTVFNSCCESDIEEMPNLSQKDHLLDTADTCQSCNIVLSQKAIATERKLGWRYTKDNKQIGSLSVLEKKILDDGLLPHNKKKHKAKVMRPVASTTSKLSKFKKVEDDSKIAISLCELLVHTSIEKPSFTGIEELQELDEPNPSPQYLNSIRVLKQKNQLLFDCVREAVETHEWKNRRRQRLREVPGPEELGKLLSENILTWSKQSADETNTAQLLNLASIEEWSDFEIHVREISLQIVDAILEDIGNEIVTDMIEYFESSLC